MLHNNIVKADYFGEKLTVSIGISLFKQNFTMIENISFADEAMYAVKNTGKNKVLIYDDLNFNLRREIS